MIRFLKTCSFLMLLAFPVERALAEPANPPLARCTIEDEKMFGSFDIYGYGRGSVGIRMNSVPNPVLIPASVTMTWMTYRVSFPYGNSEAQLEFSNYLSPSMGKFTIKGMPPKSVACALQTQR